MVALQEELEDDLEINDPEEIIMEGSDEEFEELEELYTQIAMS